MLFLISLRATPLLLCSLLGASLPLLPRAGLATAWAADEAADGAIAQAVPVCPANLDTQVQAILDRPAVRSSRWGIAVETLATTAQDGMPLYSKNATQFLVPASNAKIFVTAAALHHLGPDYRLRTSIYQEPSPAPAYSMSSEERVFRVVGRGDPGLTDDHLRDLATQLRDRGITQIDRLILDDSYFPGPQVSPSWESADVQAGYGAPTNSLILNQNAIPITLYPQALGQPLRLVWENPQDAVGWQVQNNTRTVSRANGEYIYVGRDMTRPILYLNGQLHEGSEPDLSAIAITNPAEQFGDRLQQALAQAGIRVQSHSVATQPAVALGEEVAAVESAPLAALIAEANQQSTNIYAEALLRLLGVLDTPQTTAALYAGTSAVPRILSSLGVDPRGVTLADGAGLSRQNQVTPAALVDTLQAMARSPQAQVYRDSLAIAGESGTLRSRFRATPVAGRLWGKTGTLRDTVALSGYLYPSQYEAIAFSMLVNDPNLSLGAARQAMDDIVGVLSRLQNCTSEG
jgi:D-alanyl-D-alanine carboxypeptidase/D-alanyl-D-alanine-endopeptidase (penicillin-binding protein 4)